MRRMIVSHPLVTRLSAAMALAAAAAGHSRHGIVYRTEAARLEGASEAEMAEALHYAGLTADRVPEFVQKHLVEGQPLEELVFARNPLPLVEPSA